MSLIGSLFIIGVVTAGGISVAAAAGVGAAGGCGVGGAGVGTSAGVSSGIQTEGVGAHDIGPDWNGSPINAHGAPAWPLDLHEVKHARVR